jgi:uncharacterized damage-inducible protein DinB
MMRLVFRCLFGALPLLSSAAASAQPAVMRELIEDVTTVERKVVALAKAVPAETYPWRPGEGVRSIGEVFVHIAGDNYFLPALAGVAAPPETGIDGKDFATVRRFEERRLTRAEIIAELTRSFAHLKRAMADTTAAALERPPALSSSGRHPTARQMWIETVTHVHEHLGQLIAYARSNAIAPPWSK